MPTAVPPWWSSSRDLITPTTSPPATSTTGPPDIPGSSQSPSSRICWSASAQPPYVPFTSQSPLSVVSPPPGEGAQPTQRTLRPRSMASERSVTYTQVCSTGRRSWMSARSGAGQPVTPAKPGLGQCGEHHTGDLRQFGAVRIGPEQHVHLAPLPPHGHMRAREDPARGDEEAASQEALAGSVSGIPGTWAMDAYGGVPHEVHERSLRLARTPLRAPAGLLRHDPPPSAAAAASGCAGAPVGAPADGDGGAGSGCTG